MSASTPMQVSASLPSDDELTGQLDHIIREASRRVSENPSLRSLGYDGVVAEPTAATTAVSPLAMQAIYLVGEERKDKIGTLLATPNQLGSLDGMQSLSESIMSMAELFGEIRERTNTRRARRESRARLIAFGLETRNPFRMLVHWTMSLFGQR